VRAASDLLVTVNWSLYSSFHNTFLTPTVGWYARPYAYQLIASLPFALGWPLYALALGGVAVALRRRELGDRVLLAPMGPYFAMMGYSMLVFPRYLLPLLPPLAILAARAAAIVPARRLGALLVVGVFAYSLVFSASQVARFSLDQQRAVAEWIAATAQNR